MHALESAEPPSKFEKVRNPCAMCRPASSKMLGVRFFAKHTRHRITTLIPSTCRDICVGLLDSQQRSTNHRSHFVRSQHRNSSQRSHVLSASQPATAQRRPSNHHVCRPDATSGNIRGTGHHRPTRRFHIHCKLLQNTTQKASKCHRRRDPHQVSSAG